MTRSPFDNRKTLYLASKNPGKLEEFSRLLKPLKNVQVQLASEVANDLQWEETGDTFIDNARIKAKAVKQFTNAAVLADDSGLCVAVLNDAPGVWSARYAGPNASDADNNEKLLREMRSFSRPDMRVAKFVCCLLLLDERNNEHVFWGECSGQIAFQTQGTKGFGYDSLFFLPALNRTFAELSAPEKNAISHRAKAVAALKAHLQK